MRGTLYIADLHVGSTVAVWPKKGVLPEGGQWELNLPQRYLNKAWDWFLSEAKDLPRIDAVVVNGDVLEGAKPRDIEVVTQREDYQASAAIDLLEPVREMTERFYMIRGTEFHGGAVDQNVTQVARALNATENKRTKEVTWPEMLYDIGNGDVWHIAHHVGTVRNPMYEFSALWGQLGIVQLNYNTAYGKRAPNITGIVRSHRHRMAHADKGRLHVCSVTGWKLADGFTQKVAPGCVPEVGYMYTLVDGDSIAVKQRTYPAPPFTVEGG